VPEPEMTGSYSASAAAARPACGLCLGSVGLADGSQPDPDFRTGRCGAVFEEIIPDNLDLGRPDRVQLIFDRVVTKKTPGEFRTRVMFRTGSIRACISTTRISI
jgi:hypothetical protein